jgi:nucleoside phosphorylase
MIVLVATRLEEQAARRELAGLDVRIVRTGVGHAGTFEDSVISCGLAGGLRRDVASGTVLIPEHIGRRTGEKMSCDALLVAKLREAAAAIGAQQLSAPLLTTSSLIRKGERLRFAEVGYAGADMESGTIKAPRVAAVRVILDTPDRELSEAWLHPFGVFFRPDVWRELPWLAMHAPRYARLAAKIIARALSVP